MINQDETVIGGLAGNTGNEFDSTNRIRTGFIRVEPNTTYIISGLSGFNIANSFAYDSEKTMARIGAVTTTTTLENESYLRISFSKPDQSDFTEEELQKLRKTLMFNKGGIAFPWEPYTGNQPSPSPDYPQEIINAGKYNEETQKWEYEITIANAQTDATKNQTVTLTADRPLTKWDRLIKENGVWGLEYGSNSVEYDGTEEWAINANYENVFRHSEQNMQANSEVYSNSYKQILSGLLNESDYGISTGVYINIKNKNATTIEEFKALLQSNPITVLYQLAEPVFVPLAESEQAAMNALHTYRPTTVLSNDVDCEMELTYYG